MAGYPYASIQDLEQLWRPLKDSERDRAHALLGIVSSALDAAASQVGKDLETLMEATPSLWDVARSVTVDVVARTLMTSTDHEPMTQFSDSAGGYTASGTFLVPGGGLFIKKSELARLGLRRQRVRTVSVYG